MQSQKHNSQRALAHFRAAVKAHPGEACPWYLLAEALAAEGKPKGGPDYTEEIHAAAIAVKLDPTLVVARDLLSAAYYSAGQNRKRWNRAAPRSRSMPKTTRYYHLYEQKDPGAALNATNSQ